LIVVVTVSMSAGTTFADDAVRGVTDTEIIVDTMTDLSSVTAPPAHSYGH
jgi:hypothetical protein